MQLPKLYPFEIKQIDLLDCIPNFTAYICSGTIQWNINGSSSFCKGARTSESESPRTHTLRLCMSEDLCKNYYFHSYFTIVTFLSKIQYWCYITKKNLSKHNCEKSWMVKTTTTVQNIWMGKTTTIQVFDHMT